jgi:hypothetical protein
VKNILGEAEGGTFDRKIKDRKVGTGTEKLNLPISI